MPARLIRHPALAGGALLALCATAFALGWLASDRQRQMADLPLAPAASPAERTDESFIAGQSEQARGAFAALPRANSGQALHAIEAASKTGNAFLVHYRSTYAARRLETPALVETLRLASRISGDEAGIVRLILALELAERSPQLLVELLTSADDPAPRLDLHSLFRYWATTYPRSAFEAALALPASDREAAFHGLRSSANPKVQEWVDTAKETERQQRMEDASSQRRRQIQIALAERAWRRDPAQFATEFAAAYSSQPAAGIAAVAAVDDDAIRERILQSLLLNAMPSAEEALQALDALASDAIGLPPNKRMHHTGAIISRTGAEQLPEVLQWVGQRYSRQQQNFLLSGLSSQGPEQARILASSPLFRGAPSSPGKSRLAMGIAQAIARESLDQAVDLVLDTFPEVERDRALGALLPRVASERGATAARQLFAQLSSPAARSVAVRNLAPVWSDPSSDSLADYVEWVASQPGPGLLEEALASVAPRWIQMNPEEAKEFASELPEGRMRARLQSQIGGQLAQRDPLAALEYASSVRNPQTANAIIHNAAHTWASSEPVEAIRFFLEAFPDDPISAQLVGNYAGRWARYEPATAIDYFSRLPNADQALSGSRAALREWIGYDEPAALDHLLGMPRGRQRDHISFWLLNDRHFLQRNPDAAVAVVASIRDPSLREAATELVARNGNTQPRQ